MALEIKESTAKNLFALSRNHCARPECNAQLVLKNSVNLGVICHIEGEKPNSARHNPNMDDEQRRDINNLIVLCNNCHTIIDMDVDTYTTDKLKEMKKNHESKEGELLELTDEQLQKIMEKERIRVQQINMIGDGTQIATQEGDVTVQGWMPHDVITFFQALIGDPFPKLEESQSKMRDNIENFAKTFIKIGLGKISKENKEKFSDPDLRMTLEDAVKTASRKNNPDIHKILSNLIIQRIQHDDEIKQIVFNEAISSIGKLTANQLKIIALNFVFVHVSWHTIKNWKELENFFENILSKLLPFRDTLTEFGHIESVSCGRILDIGSWDLLKSIKYTFSNLFLSEFTEEEINKLSIGAEHREKIFEKTEKNLFKCKFPNKHELEKYFENEIVDGKLVSPIMTLYDNHFIPNEKIREKIASIPLGKQLLEQCDGKSMTKLHLTSVGQAIALTYLENISDVNLDPNIWIN